MGRVGTTLAYSSFLRHRNCDQRKQRVSEASHKGSRE